MRYYIVIMILIVSIVYASPTIIQRSTQNNIERGVRECEVRNM
jgi:uncharacterized membrane protein